MSDMVERVARAMMKVKACSPAGQYEVFVLSSDPDFDDLPANGDEGTTDDGVTQEAVLLLARAAIEAMREPTDDVAEIMNGHASNGVVNWRDYHAAMIDAVLK